MIEVGDLVKSHDWDGLGVVIVVSEETEPVTLTVFLLEDFTRFTTTSDDVEVVNENK
tara:strand:- start:456 stop:626 length:171 start_codon:yes stop_codon:yes gene_type:complete